MLEGLEDTEKHKTALEIELTHVKGEYIKILDQITVLTEHNEELKIQLEEGDKQRSKMDCVVESVNVENEKLLERIHDLENELKAALDEKNDIEKQLKKKNTNEECMENELSNLRDNLRLKTFAQEEMDSALDRVCNDKQKLEEELGLIRISLEENEKAKLELAKEVNSMALQLEKLKNKQSSWNKTVDYAHLRQQVEHLKGLLSLSEQNETVLKKELESVLARASPISSDADFTQHKKQHKIRIEEQLDELEGEITIILQELSRPFQLKEKAAFRNLEKQIKTIRDEICQFRNERIHTLRKENGGKRTYRKLKKRLIRSDADIKSLKQSLQRDLQDKKEMGDEFKRQIQNDIKQVRCLLKQTTENNVKQIGEKKQFVGEEQLVKQMKEVKVILETTLLNAQKNGFELEMSRCNLQNEKAQELENKYRESNKRLQEKECDLEINKRKLKEKVDKVEELSRQLHSEREDNKFLRKSYETAECRARQRVVDLESEVTQLRKLLADRDGNAESLKEQLRKSSKELEDTKKILAQKENELISARASLHEGDKLLYTFRQTCSEIQLELEKTKRGLIEKSATLDYSERYAKMLFWSARAKDREIDMTNKLVNKVVQDVERVEKLLEIKTQAKTYEGLSQETLTKMELSKDPSNEVNAVESSPGQLERSLKEKTRLNSSCNLL